MIVCEHSLGQEVPDHTKVTHVWLYKTSDIFMMNVIFFSVVHVCYMSSAVRLSVCL